MAKNILREHVGDPFGVQGQGRLAADSTGVHDQRVDRSVDARQAGADRARIGNVHENDVEDAPPGLRFEVGHCRFRSVSVPAREIDAGDLGTQRQLSGYVLADPDVGARDQHGLTLCCAHRNSLSSFVGPSQGWLNGVVGPRGQTRRQALPGRAQRSGFLLSRR